ncbi:DUF952 domain-containing protein [Quadrisphaera granulorum]|uniref:DUF952 domain-containing protein n=1 Tax=Quadrisphaera granulorum TaxID=317664 RepID=UPI001B86B2C3|nr:DUF952 domain-containing protein [Quadrisphaera granulorum]
MSGVFALVGASERVDARGVDAAAAAAERGVVVARVLHLASRSLWVRAQAEGAYRGSTLGADLDEVGFVHASAASQLPGVVAAVYGEEDLVDHVLLVVDVDACEAAGSPVRWEAPPGGDQAYPHVYGPVPLAAVVAALDVGRDAAGALRLPDLAALDVVVVPPS